MEKENFQPALAWIFLAAPTSPADCYLYFAESKKRLLFQKKGTTTRKNLIQNLLKIGVIHFEIPDEHFRHYLDLVEQSIETSFCVGKITQFRMANQNHHLLFPLKARLPHTIQQMLKELNINEEENRKSLSLPKPPPDFELMKTLFEDIDLTASALEKEASTQEKIEIENLKKKLVGVANEIDQFKQVITDTETELAKKEADLKKSIEDHSFTHGELTKLNDEYLEIHRNFKITKAEIEGLLSGQQDAKQIYANRVASLEKRLEEIRAESQDFKLKYAKEVDKNKELQRSLSQAQTNLNRTAIALKKFTEKKAG